WINDNPEQVTDEIGDSFEEATLAVTEYMASGQAGVDRLGAEGKEADPALEQELLELLEIAEEKVNALVARINDRLSEAVTIPVNVTVAEAEQAQMAALAQLGRAPRLAPGWRAHARRLRRGVVACRRLRATPMPVARSRLGGRRPAGRRPGCRQRVRAPP